MESHLSKRAAPEQPLDLSGRAQNSLVRLRKLLDQCTDLRDFQPILAALHSQQPPLSSFPHVGPAPIIISGLSDAEAEVLVSLVYCLVIALSRSNGTNADGLAKEMNRLKLPLEFGHMLADLLLRNRAQLARSPLARCEQRRLHRIRWRLDVIVTSQLGKKIMEPVFLISLELTSRTVYFEVPMTQFHKMRYNLAVLLQEMDILNNRKIMQH